MSSDKNNMDEEKKLIDDGGLNQNLLDDDDFSSLMMSEFSASGLPEDKLSTTRVWPKIEEQISRSATNSKGSTSIFSNSNRKKRVHGFIRLFAIAAVMALAVTVLFKNSGEDTSRLKGKDSGVPATLFAKKITDAAENTFRFSVSVSQDSWNALLKKHGNENWELVSNHFKCSAGIECSVEVGHDLVYGYELDNQFVTEFCAISATNIEKLESRIDRFTTRNNGEDDGKIKEEGKTWVKGPPGVVLQKSSCLTLEKGREPYR